MFGKLFSPKEFSFKCSTCGEVHKGSPSFSFQYPIYYFDVPEDELDTRVRVTDDLCRIEPGGDSQNEETIHCVRTILEIPIKGVDQPFTWGVWVTQSKESFDRYIETFEADQSDEISFGWLAVNMPYYNTTLAGAPLAHLECDVEWGGAGQRPRLRLWDCDHQLAVDQREGISWDMACRIAELAMHGAEEASH